MNLELKPKIGIGDLKFGFSKAQCIALLGQPDQINQDVDDEDELKTNFTYFAHKLRLGFYENSGGRLGYFYCKNPNLTFLGEKIIDAKIHDVKLLFSDLSASQWDVENYDYWQVHTCYNQIWLCFDVSYDCIDQMEVGVPLADDGNEYLWAEN